MFFEEISALGRAKSAAGDVLSYCLTVFAQTPFKLHTLMAG